MNLSMTNFWSGGGTATWATAELATPAEEDAVGALDVLVSAEGGGGGGGGMAVSTPSPRSTRTYL